MRQNSIIITVIISITAFFTVSLLSFLFAASYRSQPPSSSSCSASPSSSSYSYLSLVMQSHSSFHLLLFTLYEIYVHTVVDIKISLLCPKAMLSCRQVQRFGGTCCSHIRDMKVTGSSKTFILVYQIAMSHPRRL